MGVRGLTTYISHKENSFLQDFLLHDCSLVIDGHSLCAQLYRLLNCFSAFGGDYDKFASYVRNFFKNLKKCNITPYVLFDGSYEHRKLKTAHSRLRSKIYGASKLDPVTQGSLQIFPLLVRDVFIEALIDMNVAYTVCEFEADDEVAAMARHLECPVLSYDSDFYIYNVLYIPFNTLDFKAKPIEIDGTKHFALECKIFRVEYMLKNYGGLQEELLPLLATLLGNDYVEKKVFRKFFSQMKLPKTKRKTNDQQKCIHSLFQWLQNETLETAIQKILGRLKKRQKGKALALIKKSINGYHSKNCRSLKYFNISKEDTPESDWQLPENFEEEIMAEDGDENENDNENENESSSEDEEVSSANEGEEELEEEKEGEEIEDNGTETDEDQLDLGVPDWFAEGIRQNHIPKAYINLYTHHLHFCSPQAEDYDEADSFLCCLPILRYAFDLLTDFSEEYCIYVSRESNSSYKRLFVKNDIGTSRPFDIPFSELTEDQLKTCFEHFLKEKLKGFDYKLVEQLPSNFQLFFIAILWWVANCDVPLGNIHSLIMCYVMLEAIDEKTGTFRGQFQFNNKYSKRVEELKKNATPLTFDENELFLNKNKVQYEDSLIAAHVLLKHFELDDKIKKKPKSYDSKKMQSFAQFQCCLSQINSLNTLCRSPFESTKYSKSFNGTFVYNVAVKLENQVDPKAFLEQYLRGANSVLLFYKSLSFIFEKCAEVMGLTTQKWEGTKKRRRRKRNNTIEDEINFIVKGFESEVII
uniref:SFRICE_009742 n=1 Tax=Spodoptera frugiperda TaxID=7108 RepID=A0A2H1VB07_SPOFR